MNFLVNEIKIEFFINDSDIDSIYLHNDINYNYEYKYKSNIIGNPINFISLSEIDELFQNIETNAQLR